MSPGRAFWLWHGLYALTCVGVLYLQPLGQGLLILGLVAFYHLGLWVTLLLDGDRGGQRLWMFLLPLSLLMVLPDAWLSQQQVLRFADHGLPTVAAVPIYMAFMWVIPLFFVLSLARAHEDGGAWRSALLALLVFAGAEYLAPHLQIWSPQGVVGWGGVALYILPAEAWLGAATAIAYANFDQQALSQRLTAAAMVMLSYLGAAALSLSFIEPWLSRL